MGAVHAGTKHDTTHTHTAKRQGDRLFRPFAFSLIHLHFLPSSPFYPYIKEYVNSILSSNIIRSLYQQMAVLFITLNAKW